MNYSIDIRDKDNLRTLHFGSHWTQGAMRLDHPNDLALEYTRTMMASLLMRDTVEFPQSVLLVGLGAGSLAKFLYLHYPTCILTVVEIDSRVIEVAKTAFYVPEDASRLKIVVADGVEYMRTTQQTYDLIMVDGFNDHAHPGELNSVAFYQMCRLHLSKMGILAVNLIGLSDRVKGGLAYMETAFDHRALRFPRCKSGNTIAFSACGNPIRIPLAQLQQRALTLQQKTGLALTEILLKLDFISADNDDFTL